MNDQPRHNDNAVRVDILSRLELAADDAAIKARMNRVHNLGSEGAYYATHHEQVAGIIRKLHDLSSRGLIEQLAADGQPNDSYEGNYGESRFAWHTIRLYRGANLFDPGESDTYDQFHPAQCATLPPGAVCWFSQDPRADWWPTWDQHGTYRIRPGYQLVGGGPDGDDVDVHEYWDIHVLDEEAQTWRAWNGPTVGEAKAAEAGQEQQR